MYVKVTYAIPRSVFRMVDCIVIYDVYVIYLSAIHRTQYTINHISYHTPYIPRRAYTSLIARRWSCRTRK
ncbi:hypothetical protein EON63_16950 [archaeon]|nr:MAG: hypothetical protein EON63_16950 [archaeon]